MSGSRDEDGYLRPVQAMADDNMDNSHLQRTRTVVNFDWTHQDGPVPHTTRFTFIPRENGLQDIHQTHVAKHREFTDISLRTDSFLRTYRGEAWPHSSSVQDINILASNGFFYTGCRDLVRCFHCGLGVQDWIKEDNPILVHLRFSPSCSFAHQTKAENLTKMYQKQLAETKANSTNKQRGNSYWNRTEYKHPEYQNFNQRLITYCSWPLTRTHRPVDLSQAGFFYTGTADIVRCFSCDGGLGHWDAGDDPWTEHARHFPFCHYLLQVKGEEYVHGIQTSVGRESTNNSMPLASIDNIGSSIVKEVMNIGFSKSEVEMALQICVSNDTGINANNIVNILLDEREQDETATKQVENNSKIPSKNQRVQHEGTSNTNQHEIDKLTTENERLKQTLMCKVCTDNAVNIIFLPCRHLELCETCARNVLKCPLCREDIKGKMKAILS